MLNPQTPPHPTNPPWGPRAHLVAPHILAPGDGELLPVDISVESHVLWGKSSGETLGGPQQTPPPHPPQGLTWAPFLQASEISTTKTLSEEMTASEVV